jgi:hypothetical protein
MRIASLRSLFALAAAGLVVLALAAPARAGDDVGVVVTGDSWMQPQLISQIESWLSQHGHTPVKSPLASEAINAINDCFVMGDQACARGVVEKVVSATSVVYARVDAHSNGSDAPDLTLTAYWFVRGHAAVGERTTCQRCTDVSLRTTAEDVLKKLVGGGDLGHVHLKSAPPGATIMIDGTAIGITPLDWDLPPGKHAIQMAKPGHKAGSRDVVVVSNKSELVVLTLAETDDGSGGGSGGGSRALPLGLMIGGGVALAAGAGLIVFSPKADADHHFYTSTWQAGIGVAAGGAALAAVGAWLWFRSSEPTSAPVAAISRDGAYIGWHARF